MGALLFGVVVVGGLERSGALAQALAGSPTVGSGQAGEPLRPDAVAAPGMVVAFPIGPGYSDVIPHQIVRTSDDRLYVFAGYRQGSSSIVAYWTTSPGLPTTSADFAGTAQIQDGGSVISVDAVYDGSHTVHVLVNDQRGDLEDYPFDTTSNTFGAPKALASQDPTVPGDYIGTSGVSGAFDPSGVLQVTYWSAGSHITYQGYSYNPANGVLRRVAGPTQVDTQGSADHPSVAVSPVDGSLTVAWVSEASSPAQILARTRSSAGTWGSVETASAAPVWTSTSAGINIDQGPSLLITADGTKHLTYIEDYDSSGNYGRIHVVTNRGTGWVDRPLRQYTHNPALATDGTGRLLVVGHGFPNNPPCPDMTVMCVIHQNRSGVWGPSRVLAVPTAGDSFDASASVKWSAVGLNRPETTELVFFDAVGGSYYNTTLYYARLSASGQSTPTATPAAPAGQAATPLPSWTTFATPTRASTPAPARSSPAESLTTLGPNGPLDGW